ncbi:MAG: exodeoxyribonuclease III [Puniceicoccaceae bacterium]
MKLLSWNVNGLRACLKKGFKASIEAEKPDFLCLQETRLTVPQLESLDLPDFAFIHCHPAEKAGYSGTALFSLQPPIGLETDFGRPEFKGEGRVIAAEFADYFIVNAYVPNSQNELRRLDYRVGEWEPALRDYLQQLSSQKPVLYCGDLNVAHQEIDLARPRENQNNAGFTEPERAAFSSLLEHGFLDTWRHQHPNSTGAYTWWTPRAGARARNIGWRLDYVLVSANWTSIPWKSLILPDILGSDHCPVGLQW